MVGERKCYFVLKDFTKLTKMERKILLEFKNQAGAFLLFFLILVALPVFGYGFHKSANLDTVEVLRQIVDTQLKTQQLLSKLDDEINMSEEILTEKKQKLEELERQHKLLELTPEQAQVVQDYNKTVGQVNSIKEWLSKKDVIYNLGAGFIISLIFFILGNWWGKRSANKHLTRNN